MSKQTHTPTPWILEDRKGMGNMGNVITYGTVLIAQVFCWDKKKDSKIRAESIANAEFIVRACNSHEELLNACKSVLKLIDKSGTGGMILRRAISKAEGK